MENGHRDQDVGVAVVLDEPLLALVVFFLFLSLAFIFEMLAIRFFIGIFHVLALATLAKSKHCVGFGGRSIGGGGLDARQLIEADI